MSCTTVRTPAGFLPNRKEVQYDSQGGWMALIYHSSYNSSLIANGGELIAIDKDSVYILSPDENFTIISTNNIEQAALVIYKRDPKGFVIWWILGTLSTISNGLFAIFTAPLWLITGTTVTATEASRPNKLYYPGTPWQEMGKFARFPQGIPEGLNPKELKYKN